MTVPELVFQAARQWPETIAVYENDDTTTYAELSALILQVSQDLTKEGIGSGQCVGVLGGNSAEFIALAFAVMSTGAVVMPISNQLKADEIATIVDTAHLHAIVDDHTTEISPLTEVKAIIETPKGSWRLCLNPMADPQKIFTPFVENPALIRFTSGTTGASKGVILSHQAILERTEAANKALQLRPGDTVVWVLQMAYHFVVSIILYLRYGATIAICDSFIADTIIETTRRHKGTFLYASPLHIRMLANDKTDRSLDSLHTVISTSTAISTADCNAFFNRYGKAVSQAYGIIEIGLPIINLERSEVHPEAVGYALPDYEVEMLDDEWQPLPAGAIGHLAIKGPGMFDAYLAPPRHRDEVLQNGWFLTGDLASKKEDGLITIEGRKKSMINVSGNKVFPEEVEEVLNQHPAVAMSRVSGKPHAFLGECVTAEVIVKEGQAFEVESMITFCRQRLSTYKVPQRITAVESLPMTDSGKLIRH